MMTLNKTSRVLLMADLNADAGPDRNMLELFGYEAVLYEELTLPSYRHNNGMVPDSAQLHHNLGLEMVEGTLIVLHPQFGADRARELARMCLAMRVPLVRLADLPMQASVLTDEMIDAANIAGSMEFADVPMKVVHSAHAHLLLPPDPTGETMLDEAMGYTAPEHLRVVRPTAPALGRLARVLGAVLRPIKKVMAWGDRVLGDSLKNPMARELREQPSTYRLDTTPVTTTG